LVLNLVGCLEYRRKIVSGTTPSNTYMIMAKIKVRIWVILAANNAEPNQGESNKKKRG